MNLILQIFFNPVKTFNELKRENKFPGMVFVILLLLTTVNLILMVPVTSKVMQISISSMSIPMPEQQLDAMMSMMHKLRYLMVISGVFSVVISLFLYALLLYVITVIAKPSITYVKAFTLITYSYFIALAGEFVNTGILYIRGLEKITNPYEIMFTGLNIFTTVEETGSAGIYILLCLINPFQLLFVVLLSIGLKIFANIKFMKALIICTIVWLITIAFPVGSVIFSEMAMNKAGLM
jgi:Yip1 domain.